MLVTKGRLGLRQVGARVPPKRLAAALAVLTQPLLGQHSNNPEAWSYLSAKSSSKAEP